MSVDLSIIIVNWNTRELLADCLASIYANPPGCAFEVMVVDNGSTDGSREMLKERYPQVRLIESPTNLGFGAANNRAAEVAQGEYLLLLNSDTLVHPGAVDALLAHLRSHPQTGIVAPRLLNADGSLQVSAHPMPSLGREVWRLLHLDRLRAVSQYPPAYWQSQAAQKAEVLMGACLLVRRQDYLGLGGFDERFFMYSEEVDLCKRYQNAGWGITYLPAVAITHLGGQTARLMPDQMFVELHRSKVRFFRKHYGVFQTAVYKAVLWLSAAAHGLGGWLLGAAWRNKARQYRMLAQSVVNF